METFDEMLNFDPLDAAEQVTGKSYKDSQETAALGFALHLAHAEEKRDELNLRDDTYWGMEYREYTRIVEDLGFTRIHRCASRAGQDEQAFYWLDGLLLVCGSYKSHTLNDASIYFNAEFKDMEEAWNLRASGHLHGESYDQEGRSIWIGEVDAREALRHTMGKLSQARVLKKWIEEPHLYLSTGEERDLNADEVARQKVAAFPSEVREAMGLAGDISS